MCLSIVAEFLLFFRSPCLDQHSAGFNSLFVASPLHFFLPDALSLLHFGDMLIPNGGWNCSKWLCTPINCHRKSIVKYFFSSWQGEYFQTTTIQVPCRHFTTLQSVPVAYRLSSPRSSSQCTLFPLANKSPTFKLSQR